MSQEHDKLFHKHFQDKENLINLLENSLPSEIVQDIDWQSLRLEDRSFIE